MNRRVLWAESSPHVVALQNDFLSARALILICIVSNDLTRHRADTSLIANDATCFHHGLCFSSIYFVHGSLIGGFDDQFIDVDVPGTTGDPDDDFSDVF